MNWKQASRSENGALSVPDEWVFPTYYEAFNLLFRIENALRIFVYIVLKNELREKWADAQVIVDDEQGTLSTLSKRRMSQAQTFGYLGHAITCPIMHLNSGELTRLIVSENYWKLFKPHFFGSKEIIKSKLDEIGSIRNSLAHFRPIRTDDVDVIKQNSKHVLLGIEKFLAQILTQSDVIPTNTPDEWYANLQTLGTEQCKFTFRQSPDEHWVRISMQYACPILKKDSYGPEYFRFTLLTLRSSEILKEYPEIAKHICSLSETTNYPRMQDGNTAIFRKTIHLILSRSTLASEHVVLKKSLEALLISISKETELIQQDNLARGRFIHSESATASLKGSGDSRYWAWDFADLKTKVMENDPPEYWGDFGYFGGDFIAETDEYPWMPEAVSVNPMF